MWILQLNDMRSPKIEITTVVCKAETPEELEAFLKREEVGLYQEDGWGKHYRKDGPLEWYNPPFGGSMGDHLTNIGTEDMWAEAARMNYREGLSTIPDIPS